MKDNKTLAQQWDGVRKLHDQLAAGNRGYRWVHPGKDDDGVTILGWIDYEDWLWDGIWDGIYLLDKHLSGDWKPHYDRLNDYSVETIPQASVGELTAWFILLVTASASMGASLPLQLMTARFSPSRNGSWNSSTGPPPSPFPLAPARMRLP